MTSLPVKSTGGFTPRQGGGCYSLGVERKTPGAKLKEIREARGFTQAELSAAMKRRDSELTLGDTMISMVEDDKRTTTIAKAENWAKACGCELVLNFAVSGKSAPVEVPAAAVRAVTLLTGMDDERLKATVDVLLSLATFDAGSVRGVRHMLQEMAKERQRRASVVEEAGGV